MSALPLFHLAFPSPASGNALEFKAFKDIRRLFAK
jgi:extradiol dioxygenase family protein